MTNSCTANGRIRTAVEMPKRVLLVDDNVPFSTTVKHGLETRGISVRVEATIAAALSALQGEAYEHLILELNLPDGAGERVLEHVLARDPTVYVVVVSSHLDGVRCANLVGKCRYLPKPGLTFEALLAVMTRDAVAGLSEFAADYQLSKQETAVLGGLVDGLTVDDIAIRLSCRPSTVKTYLQRMFNKTGRSSQTELLGTLVSSLIAPRRRSSGEYLGPAELSTLRAAGTDAPS